MAKKYTTPYEVAYYDGDITGKMTIPSMLAVVIKTSEEQSDSLDRGNDFVASFGLGWVITNYEIHITRLPIVGEKVAVTTQGMAYNKYFCYRNFWIHDEQGNECVLIKSTFVLMDRKNRKMSNVIPEIVEPFDIEKITKIYRSEKIEKVEDGEFLPYRVRYFDIDGNQHVNNAIYFNWLLDVLGYDFLSTNEPTFINVKFDKEVEYGQVVESHYEMLDTEDGKTTRHEIRIDGQIYCEANMNWKKSE
ncbi:acyl-ACP thioesterase [Enterococcus sp. DIV0212c]|uniref:acyl-ACP thioesterase domain-containing protein n=1 Tax=Enterococcus sp. DIV0212c TaxID=2230867 RepID=UPI001A9A8D5A|nr:acyl-[acyl-carrier-protein] thioesterase [Enterococcus sp. DIV0212c]